MKFIKYLLLFFLILKINSFVESAVDCQKDIDYTIESSCGKNPSKLYIIDKSIYYFESIGITPYSQPVYDDYYSYYYWILNDGIEYTLSYRYKGCENVKSQTIVSQGMYFKLLSEPLCPNTYFNYTIYNSGENGGNTNYSNTPQNIVASNYDGSCFVEFLVTPLSNSKGALQSGAAKYTYPTCGFSNGSISVDLTKGYSNCHLYSQFDYELNNEIQPSSTCFYSGLDSFYYYLFVDSKECATERLSIQLVNVFTPMEITFENVPDFNQNSIVSLSLSSGDNGILNKTNSFATMGGAGPDPLTTWSHKEIRITQSTQYGYFYNKDFTTDPNQVICYFNDGFELKGYNSNFNFTVSKSDSCSENVTITFYPLPTQTFVIHDYLLGNQLSLNNNVLSVQYNKYLQISETSSNSERYYSTSFYTPTYRIVETSNGIGCWKTYNITIGEYEIYTNLTLKVYNGDEYEFFFYPIDGVFVNVPANYFYLFYKVKDCQIESVIMIDKSDNNTPMDDVKMDINIIEIGNCTHETSILVTVDTVFGNFSKVFSTFSYNNLFYFYLPNCSCSIESFYSIPPLIDGESFTYTFVNDPDCNSTGNVIQLFGSNGNTIQEVYSNGVQLIANNQVDVDFAYNFESGENNVTIKYSNSKGTCYKSQMINIVSPYEVPLVQVTPVIDCDSADGKITISNYLNFSNLNIIIGSSTVQINSGLVTNLPSGTYTILYGNYETCANSINVYVPTSEDYVEITTSVIFNPTCGEGTQNGDGKISVTLKNLGVKINNFYIQNQNINPYLNFPNGVYIAAAPGLNTLSISYGGCIWKRDVNTTISKPTFSFEKIYNDTCLSSVYYKLVNNNPNITINSVTSIYSLYNYQNQYYTQMATNLVYPYTITWNTYCSETFYQEITFDTPFNYYSSYLQYEIVKADNCDSFKIDIIIKNMNSFQTVTLSKKYPTPMNSTHAIFKNLPPSTSYDISFTLFDGCSGVEMVGYQQLSNGNTKETMDIIKVNDICSSGKGSIQLSNMDITNHYYNVKTFTDYYVYTTFPIQPTSYDTSNGTNFSLISNLRAGIYNITKNCKSITNCYIETKVVIENQDPIIESISVTDSYDKLNNGTVEIKLNYNSTFPINFKIIGTQFSNQNGRFENLPAKTYEVHVTLTDRMCPITISQSFTINLKTPPPLPSPQDPSDELSTSSFIQLNILSFLLISILTIFIL
ncbi:hypothetical protein ACTFIZ_001967 [Dictyostelium cf. discoideum]